MSMLARLKRPTIRDRRSHLQFVGWAVAVSLCVALCVDVANQFIFFIDWTTSLRSWAITIVISVALAATIAYLLGVTQLELYRAKQASDALSHTDSLTGIANRRALIESAEASLPDVLALAIFDIDRFKAVNDTYGHLAGDAVLRAVARMMAEELGELGRVARVGGEEFALLSWGVSAEALVARLVGFRDRLRATPILVGDLTLRVTISAGVALCQGCDNFDRLYSHADRALYEAKAAGRNRFQFPAALEPLVDTTVMRFDPALRTTISRTA